MSMVDKKIEIVINIHSIRFFTFIWGILFNDFYTHTLLKKQGVLFSSPTAIISS